MLAEYTSRFYVPAHKRFDALIANDIEKGKALAKWRQRINNGWRQLYVESVNGNLPGQLHVGQEFSANAKIYLGDLNPHEVLIELYVGLVNTSGEIVKGQAIPMKLDKQIEQGLYLFTAEAECSMSGLHGYTIRVIPYHENLVTPFLPGLIKWAG